ncbi:hypothetical protein X734_00250 [Mesorhizobium sp. L2C084A000]|nr:hypothetical protein X734_00250 [Mesorhizobium sp. L2C084A000]
MRSVINYNIILFRHRDDVALCFISIGVTYGDLYLPAVENEIPASQIDVTTNDYFSIGEIFLPYLQGSAILNSDFQDSNRPVSIL